jgi:hypothetical protein
VGTAVAVGAGVHGDGLQSGEHVAVHPRVGAGRLVVGEGGPAVPQLAPTSAAARINRLMECRANRPGRFMPPGPEITSVPAR